MYYDKEQEKFSFGKGNPPKGILSLRFALAIQDVGKKNFQIIVPERTYEFQAHDTTLRRKWVLALQAAQTIYHKLEIHTAETWRPFGVSLDDLCKDGFLDVKSWFGWNEYYVILRDGILYIFTAKGGSRKYKIPLYNSHMEPLDSLEDGRYGFKLLSPDGEITEIQLSCSDEIANHQWMNGLLKQKLMIEEAINLISF